MLLGLLRCARYLSGLRRYARNDGKGVIQSHAASSVIQRVRKANGHTGTLRPQEQCMYGQGYPKMTYHRQDAASSLSTKFVCDVGTQSNNRCNSNAKPGPVTLRALSVWVATHSLAMTGDITPPSNSAAHTAKYRHDGSTATHYRYQYGWLSSLRSSHRYCG